MKEGVPPEGTVLVRWQISQRAELIMESKLELVDRSLLIGDVVKRNATEASSGVVINTFTKCTLRSISDVTFRESGQNKDTVQLKGLPPLSEIDPRLKKLTVRTPPLIHDVPAAELADVDDLSVDDIVIYKGWVGGVMDTDYMISLRLSDNCVVEVHEDLLEHLDGAYNSFSVGDIASTKKSSLRLGKFIFGQYNPNTPPFGTVVAARLTSVSVAWIDRGIGIGADASEPATKLERMELESSSFKTYDKTRRPAAITRNIETNTVSYSESEMSLGLRVRFRDLADACVRYDGSGSRSHVPRVDRRETLGYDLNVFDVVNFQTDVIVQWQDLTITRERSIHLIAEHGFDDEHDAWPGEIAHSLELEPLPGLDGASDMRQPRTVGVIQSVNAAERMAKMRCSRSSYVQYSANPEATDQKELISSNIGRAEEDIEEVSLYDIEAPGELNVRRGDIVIIPGHAELGSSTRFESSDTSWVGEVVDTRLDGLLTIRLGAADDVRDIQIERYGVRVIIRSDDVEEWHNAIDSAGMRINSDGELESVDGSDEDFSVEEADHSSSNVTSSESEEEQVYYEDENGEPMDIDDVEDGEWESAAEEDDHSMEQDTDQAAVTSQSATSPKERIQTEQVNGITRSETTSEPEQYLILETPVPSTQAFAGRSETSTPAHTKRVAKEHRILRTPSNLPKGVYVRSWESRLDLLRILIIGPEGTPYALAPFTIDFYLPPGFPVAPPEAYFHSWTLPSGLGGVGRVNPNLYEDGKICLSLLGTWESGGKSEGWSAGRSTLLQVIVSLLGLVLVKQPYFNEAGYEALVGAESARRASEVYSERVFLKARCFVLAAFTEGGEGQRRAGTECLEDILQWLYRTDNGPKLLKQCVQDVREVLSRSERGGERDEVEDAPVMSKGACIPLRRVLERLEELKRAPLPM